MSLIAQRNNVRLKALPDFHRSPAAPNFQFLNGQLVSIPDNGRNYIEKGYNVNDIIYSIIELILNKVRVAPWGVYQIKDESSLKQLHAIQSKTIMSPEDFLKAKDLSIKAMEPVRDPGKIGDLLDQPNEEDGSFCDFVANSCGYKLLTGNKLIKADLLDMGANAGLPNSLHIMPSQWVSLRVETGFPGKILGYQMEVLGLTGDKSFSRDIVLHEKYKNYDWSVNGIQFWGMAPLKSSLRRLNRNNSAVDASAAKLQNGGVEAIIYLDDDRVPAASAVAQAAATKRALINEWTGPENWGKVVSVPYKTGVANLGLSPVELAILDAEKADMRFFCNVYGVPSQMLNDPENKSWNNQKEGEKALTNRCALPLLTSFRNSLNNKLHTTWGWKQKKAWFVDFDMTVFSELQQDMKEMMDWLKPLMEKGLPLNRAMEMLNLEKINDPLFDEPWITPSMGQPLSEWQMNEVDNALNNDQP